MRTAVSGLLDRFKQQSGSHAVNLRSDDGPSYNVTVSPVQGKRSAPANLLVEIRPLDVQDAKPGAPADDSNVVAAEYVESLERDLEFARGELQSTVEELEAANEELQAAN